jgi:hypothetical protein
MSKKILVFVLVFLVTCAVAHAQENGESADEGTKMEKSFVFDKSLTLDPPEEGMEAKRAAVSFPHLQHSMDYGCSKCHHEWDMQKRNVPQSCVSCHNDFELTHGESSYFGAYHSRQSEWSCVGCHSKQGEKSAAPLKCPACHQE